MPTWTVDEPATIELDEPISRLKVRLVGGRWTWSRAPARLVEVSEIDGLPLTVSSTTAPAIGYDDVVWPRFSAGCAKNGGGPSCRLSSPACASSLGGPPRRHGDRL